MLYLITKTTGDDGSDITGCLLAISDSALKDILELDKIADEVSTIHLSFNALSFNINRDTGTPPAIEVHWTTDSDWEERYSVGADDDHAFINEREYERLKRTADPQWSIFSDRIVFNQYGDCFIEGSYENAHGCEESALLPLGELQEMLSAAAASTSKSSMKGDK